MSTPSALPLTQRQGEVLDTIRQYLRTHGAPPTRAEIARIMGFKSINAAEDHLKALAKKGAIVLSSGTARGIQLPSSPAETVPLLYTTLKTTTLLDSTNIQDSIPMPATCFPKPIDYCLTMPHGKLKNKGILEGDLLAIHRTHQAHANELVVDRHQNTLQIKPYTEGSTYIEGVVVGVIRTL